MNVSEMPYPPENIFPDKSTWYVLDDQTHPKEDNIAINVSRSATLIDEITTIVWYVVPPFLFIFGTFGNVMTVVVMRGMRASHSTACLSLFFTALAVSDQIELMTSVLFFFVQKTFSWPPSFFAHDLLCSVPKFLWNVTALSSAWLLVTMTYQRVVAVIAPHRVGMLCSVRRGKCILAFIVMFAFSCHLQFMFTWVYWPEHRDCQYREKYMHFAEAFEWFDLMCFSILPCTFLVTGNSILIWQVIKSMHVSQKMRGSVDQQTTAGTDKVNSMSLTLIFTSAAYMVLTVPICTYDVCLQMVYLSISDDYSIAVMNLGRSVVYNLWMASCASNFYLYLLSGNKFRQEAKRYVCCHEGITEK